MSRCGEAFVAGTDPIFGGAAAADWIYRLNEVTGLPLKGGVIHDRSFTSVEAYRSPTAKRSPMTPKATASEFHRRVTSRRSLRTTLRGTSEFGASKGRVPAIPRDSIIPTWSTPSWTKRFAPDLVAEIAKDANDFYRIACTIGGYIVFPRNRAGQTGRTINQSRGLHPAIADRFDLTLECIRRHYSEPAAENPLGSRLADYGDFFALFGDFDTYVRFFLLDDLVTEDRAAVRSLVTGEPLRGFRVPAFAATAAEYADYRHRTINFVTARNERIRQLGL